MNDPMKKWANELYKAFIKEEIKFLKKTCKKMLTILAIKEIQFKTILRF
jgi:hypothetical protein